MKRILAAVLLAVSLSLTGACSNSQSGDSFSDNPTDQAPGVEGDDPEDVEGEANLEDGAVEESEPESESD